jgi:DNA invertase Pin-like site-specific DNA recombinase
MKIKYQRTSTIKQHGERFKTDKNNYDLVLFDKGVSGTKPFAERTESKKIIEFVESGRVEELVVEELRDIGRNMVDTINTLDFFEKHKINVVVRSLGNLSSRVEGEGGEGGEGGKKNEIWSLITSVMSSLYQMELENLKMRTNAGREAYLMNGGVLGRKKGTNESVKEFLDKPKSKMIISLLEKKKSVRDIAGRLGVSDKTVTKVRKYYNV